MTASRGIRAPQLRTTPGDPRLSAQPLLDILADPSHSVKERLGDTMRSQLYKWVAAGDNTLTVAQADHLAVKLGLHPSQVWVEWWEVPINPAALGVCQAPGCDKVSTARGWCRNHWRLWRAGRLVAPALEAVA